MGRSREVTFQVVDGKLMGLGKFGALVVHEDKYASDKNDDDEYCVWRVDNEYRASPKVMKMLLDGINKL